MKNVSELLKAEQELREKLAADTARPAYHFLCPAGKGVPGDPNGAFYANGRVHLMFLYRCEADGFRYGHLSCTDLLHWRRHPDALIPDELDRGIFSGGAFADDDGTVYMTYWALKSEDVENGPNGIRVAYSKDAEHDYEKWVKMPEEAVPATKGGIRDLTMPDGSVRHLSAADPSNIWKKDGLYYFQAGNLMVLNRYGRNEKSAVEYRGDYTDLYRSADLKNWEPVHRFYQRKTDNLWTHESEDDMCPSFLPLPTSSDGGAASDKWLQLFISHNKGCQYYIGTYDRQADRFLPERHGRMSWVDRTFFAPEALILPDGRQVMWAWLNDSREHETKRFGWSGVYGVPRSLWLRPDGTLGIAPVAELRTLRGQEWKKPGEIRSNRCEIEVTFAAGKPASLDVMSSPDGKEFVRVAYDPEKKELSVDTSACGTEGARRKEAAPLDLPDGEALSLDIFVDASIVEVFANGRQAISRRAFPKDPKNNAVAVSGEPQSFLAWEMDYTNPF